MATSDLKATVPGNLKLINSSGESGSVPRFLTASSKVSDQRPSHNVNLEGRAPSSFGNSLTNPISVPDDETDVRSSSLPKSGNHSANPILIADDDEDDSQDQCPSVTRKGDRFHVKSTSHAGTYTSRSPGHSEHTNALPRRHALSNKLSPLDTKRMTAPGNATAITPTQSLGAVGPAAVSRLPLQRPFRTDLSYRHWEKVEQARRQENVPLNGSNETAVSRKIAPVAHRATSKLPRDGMGTELGDGDSFFAKHCRTQVSQAPDSAGLSERVGSGVHSHRRADATGATLANTTLNASVKRKHKEAARSSPGDDVNAGASSSVSLDRGGASHGLDSGDGTKGDQPMQKRQRAESTSSPSRVAARGSLTADTATPKRSTLKDKSASRLALLASGSRPLPALQSNHASYQEWPLRDAVLKRVRENGRAMFQFQFTWNVTAEHSAGHGNPVNRHREAGRPGRKPYRSDTPHNRVAVVEATNDDDVYEVDCLLGRWGKNLFFLRWADGSFSWELRRNISEELVRDFEAAYDGFHLGVDILRTRRRGAKVQYRLNWHGRPTSEDSWVDEKLISKQLLQEYQDTRASQAS